jgi:hypothetical protein
MKKLTKKQYSILFVVVVVVALFINNDSKYDNIKGHAQVLGEIKSQYI